ncbi:hypothetical protein HHUSO_G31691 [Huso huso]|uniref:Uncharacterized protein n=1 Tax=Huso huso TaxID=61971 RepID=A0ABR0YBQ2_HUSHU
MDLTRHRNWLVCSAWISRGTETGLCVQHGSHEAQKLARVFSMDLKRHRNWLVCSAWISRGTETGLCVQHGSPFLHHRHRQQRLSSFVFL